MITYIQIFVLSLIICADSPSAQSRTSISVTVGSTAVLPCDWRNSTQSSSQSPHVEWCTFAGTVFERRGGEVYQGEGYEDRVDVPEDHLLKGDCSLELKDVRPEDAGFYESYLLVRRTKTLISKRVFLQSVELSVEGKEIKLQTIRYIQRKSKSFRLSKSLIRVFFKMVISIVFPYSSKMHQRTPTVEKRQQNVMQERSKLPHRSCSSSFHAYSSISTEET
uniref:Immunoglobulin V-set domain-containing protein n=1 Tax=Pygocentrus nattereri TaxID=42514 RepID=A0AAR2J0B1_PYGNA